MNNFSSTFRNPTIGRFWILLIGLVLAAESNAFGQSGIDDSKTVVKKLLIDHWEKNKTNRDAGEKLLKESTANEAVLFSYSVQRIQQNRKKSAVKPLRTLTASNPKDLDALMLKSWLDTVTDDFDSSLTGMTALKSAISDPATKLNDATRKQVLKRLGRMIGYFSGPVKSKVNANSLDQTIETVLDGLPADDVEILNEQRDKVLAQFKSLTKTRDNKLEQETVKAKQNADVKKKQLEKENELIDTNQKNITPQIDKLRSDAQQQVSSLQSEVSPLQSALSEANRSIAQAESNLLFSQFEIARLQSARGIDPQNDFFIDQRIGLLLNQLQFRRFEVGQLYRQRDQIYNQLNNVGVRIAETENRFGGQINNLSAEIDNGTRAKRRTISS